LDEAAPDHPVRLDHRGGHAAVLNSLGLQLAGIHRETPDPVAGVIERVPDTGEPTGVLLEMSEFLRERLGNVRNWPDLEAGVRAASRQLLSYGVTSVQDAGADNGLERWTTFQQLRASETLGPRVTTFAGAERMDEFLNAGMRWGTGDHRLRLGHMKVMLTLTTGTLSPPLDEISRLTRLAHQAGFPVAVHCIEQEAVRAAAEVLGEQRAVRRVSEGVTPRDRIEHCAECPQELIDLVRRSGAMVVTQPGFIYWNGPGYRERVAEELKPHLYPAGALHRAGVSVAFGSDAPVIDPNPWPGIYSAVTRLAHDGHPVAVDGTGQTVDLESALRMYTLGGAVAEGTATDKGSITPGKLADLVLVDRDPLATDRQSIKDIQPVLTILGGKIAWEDGSNA
jgi:predicted amidohydrolase YtcJ